MLDIFASLWFVYMEKLETGLSLVSAENLFVNTAETKSQS